MIPTGLPTSPQWQIQGSKVDRNAWQCLFWDDAVRQTASMPKSSLSFWITVSCIFC